MFPTLGDQDARALLQEMLEKLPEGACDLALLQIARDPTISWLRSESSSARILQKFVRTSKLLLVHDPALTDPTLLLNLASLFVFLRADVERSQDIREALLRSARFMVDRLLDHAQAQVVALCAVVREVAHYLLSLGSLPPRVILIELPIGNSLPSKMLHNKLQQADINVQTILVSLNRNDAIEKGMKRKTLLQQKLMELGITQNDFVILADEWLSGTNFYHITNIIESVVKSAGAFFLPVALMTAKSKEAPRYKTYIQNHNKIVSRLGISGEAFRFVFPSLAHIAKDERYFFWGEHDRLAGYRKVQIMGAIASAIIKSIEELDAPQNLKRSYAMWLHLVERDLEKSEAARAKATVTFGDYTALWKNSYKCRSQFIDRLKTLDDLSNIDADADAGEATQRVCEKVLLLASETDFSTGFSFIIPYLLAEAARDIQDRYYFNHHVPLIVNLEGDYRYLHTYTLERLEQACSI